MKSIFFLLVVFGMGVHQAQASSFFMPFFQCHFPPGSFSDSQNKSLEMSFYVKSDKAAVQVTDEEGKSVLNVEGIEYKYLGPDHRPDDFDQELEYYNFSGKIGILGIPEHFKVMIRLILDAAGRLTVSINKSGRVKEVGTCEDIRPKSL